MTVVFISNYLTAHQIPFCLEMRRLLQEGFTFIATEPISQERLALGWKDEKGYDFERRSYESPEQRLQCKKLVFEADAVLLGAANVCWISKRLRKNKSVFYVTERYYKVKPKWKQYPAMMASVFYRHNRFLGKPLYVLCAGAFVKQDLESVHAYYKDAYQWGYFPQMIEYDAQALMQQKNTGEPHLLWCGRFLDWKHPDMALRAALFLKKKAVCFHMDMIGSGVMKEELKAFISEKDLSDTVTLHDAMPPDEIRRYMEKADIYLATSDRFEGWGAVVNEAMNSGCAVVAADEIGSVPYLIEDGINGFVFESGNQTALNTILLRLIYDTKRCLDTGENAYETVSKTWHAKNAAVRLVHLLEGKEKAADSGPCSRA
ncbi:Glycosyltransferase Gtf1 [bioreactor metagenome]|uniref:Glycosyltransferase Gtf1 n=1 Tax=bioreactor metagenome TaxID=1076179 RepID=A0A645BF53_9ZZZZ